jgi:hypothetical protein
MRSQLVDSIYHGGKHKVILHLSKSAVGTTNTTAGAKKGAALNSWHLLPLTQNREEPKKDSDIAKEPRNEFLPKPDFASRRITPPQNMP